MTDLETTGDVFSVHEILEIGLVVFTIPDFTIIDTLDIKVNPVSIENAIPAALERNGYTPERWEGAVTLKEGVQQYATQTKDAIFCAYNATFDWGFMNEAFRKTGVKNEMAYNRLDLLSLAWGKMLRNKESWSLKSACELLDIPPEPEMHSAFNGALCAFELFKKLY